MRRTHLDIQGLLNSGIYLKKERVFSSSSLLRISVFGIPWSYCFSFSSEIAIIHWFSTSWDCPKKINKRLCYYISNFSLIAFSAAEHWICFFFRLRSLKVLLLGQLVFLGEKYDEISDLLVIYPSKIQKSSYDWLYFLSLDSMSWGNYYYLCPLFPTKSSSILGSDSLKGSLMVFSFK